MRIYVNVVRGPERPRRWRRRVVLLAAVAAAVAAPLAYSAAKDAYFSDVPSSAADSPQIDRVYLAGIMKPCATEPSLMFCPNQTTIRRGLAKQYDYALQAIRETPYGKWRDYDLEDSVRFWALRLHEAGFIKSNPKKIIGQSTDMRFFNELKKELKG